MVYNKRFILCQFTTQNQKIKCTVEVLTRNSAATLGFCLESIKDFAEIIVLDGNSMDRTREIMEHFGCKIVPQYNSRKPNIAIKDYSEVCSKGLAMAQFDWFMYIDSDEYLSLEAVREIRSIAENQNQKTFQHSCLARLQLYAKEEECWNVVGKKFKKCHGS